MTFNFFKKGDLNVFKLLKIAENDNIIILKGTLQFAKNFSNR